MALITRKTILESAAQVRAALARLLSGHMNYQRLLRRASVAIVPVLWLVLAPTVYAEEAIPAGGTETTTLSPVSTRTADGNTVIGFTLVEIWQGTFGGTRVGSGSLVIHADGSINAESSGILTGTIAGRSGTALLRFHVSGTFAAATATFTVTDGTGGLAGVHAEGTEAISATGPLSVAATYSGVVHFSAP